MAASQFCASTVPEHGVPIPQPSITNITTVIKAANTQILLCLGFLPQHCTKPLTLPHKKLHEEEEEGHPQQEARSLVVPHKQPYLSQMPPPLISSATAFSCSPPFLSGCPPHPGQLLLQPCCLHTHITSHHHPHPHFQG